MSILILAYLVFGLLFGLWFFFDGHARLDTGSIDAAWYTRLMWFPGSVLLWPLLLSKLFAGRAG